MAGAITLISKILPGSPQHGVLEGRKRLAGGETTGSYRMPTVLSGGAPVGAREASAVGSQSGPHSPLCGAPLTDGPSLAGLSLGPLDFRAQMVNANAPDFGAPHRGLCGPLSNPALQPR